MARNVILLVSSAAILVALFLGYSWLVRDPASDHSAGAEQRALPDAHGDPKNALEIGNGERTMRLPGGEAIVYTLFDSRTGRARQIVRFADWTKVPSSDNEILVTSPEMTMLLPGGQIATISAAEGQMAVDEIRRSDMQPQSGWLRGGARIVIDRATDVDRAPADQRPDDFITIEMDELEFDITDGLLRTAGPVSVVSTAVELRGVGLELVWNQTHNRLERLRLEHSGELIMHNVGDLLGGTASPDDRAPTTAPSEPPPPRDQRQLTSYLCSLNDNVSIEQQVAGVVVGGLTASAVDMLFDGGGGGTRWGTGSQSRTDAPTTAATNDANGTQAPATAANGEQPQQQLVARWQGPLTIAPLTVAGNVDAPRRRLSASGGNVHLFRGERSVLCGRLEFREDTDQIWLHPRDDGRVLFRMGDDQRLGVEASADNAYVDVAGNLVKLIGNVRLVDQRHTGARSGMALHCRLWAELHLAQPEEGSRSLTDAAEGVVALSGLRAAVFVGDVALSMGDQRLRAARVDLSFRTGTDDTPIEGLLEKATAGGNVVLIERLPGTVEPLTNMLRAGLWVALSGTHTADAHAAQALRCDWLEASFAADADGVIHTREAVASGAVELLDRKAKVAARGRELTAHFDEDGQLAHAVVSGRGSRPAWVYAEPFAVRGERVDLDPHTQSLHIPGRSHVSFKSRVSLQGRSQRSETATQVTSSQSMRLSGPDNTVAFEGNVVATSGDEHLWCDTLTLHLENADAPEQATPNGLGSAWKLLTRGGANAQPAPADSGLMARPRRRQFERKRPVRLVATNAIVESESYEPGDPLPIMHSSIRAPQLVAEIPQRIVKTTGGTELLMTSRRLDGDVNTEQAVSGVPSGLVTRGPSQTAMKCDGPMTYVIGSEGPERRDYVLLEDNVLFVHRAGREMHNFDEMMPKLADDPERIATLQNRNTYMTSQRLEGVFAVEHTSPQRRARQSAGPPLALSRLIAGGGVFLRDRQGTGIREVHANQLEYDATSSLIRVLGTEGPPPAPARIYYSNPETGEFHSPGIGMEFEIDLRSNQLRLRAPSLEGTIYQKQDQ